MEMERKKSLSQWDRLNVSNNHVIASQSADWRGNLLDFQTFLP